MIEDLNVSYSKYFNIDLGDWDQLIPMDILTVRSRNCLTKEGILSYGQLLKLTPEELKGIRSLGHKSVEEIEKMILLFIEELSVVRNQTNTDLSCLIPYIRDKDYSFLDTPGQLDSCIIAQYKNLENCWGRESIQEFIEHGETAQDLLNIVTSINEKLFFMEQLSSAMKDIPKERMQVKAALLLNLFNSVNPKCAAVARQYLSSEDDSLLLYCNKVSKITCDNSVITFIRWSSFKIDNAVQSFFSQANQKYLSVIPYLSDGGTLESVGEIFGVTRERIRQMKSRVSKEFSIWSARIPIMGMISADLGYPQIIKEDDIRRLVGPDSADVILYLLKQEEYDSYVYNKDLDAFIMDWSPAKGEDIAALIKTLPKYYTKDDFEDFIVENSGRYDAELLRQYMNGSYEYHNGFFLKGRLSVGDRCDLILKEYYPSGIHVYSDDELEKFARHYVELFDDIPSSNRALAARIMSVGILCDRGTYKPKDISNITDEIKQSIDSYIQNVDQPIFVVGDLFEHFQNELVSVGVLNKYHLQAILQEVFFDKYRTRRNFLFKDSSAISIYDEVSAYVESSTYPVSISDIRNAIVGVNNIYINWAIAADNSILNLFGEYYHSSHLDLSDYEISILHEIIETTLSDGGIHHVKDFHTICEKEVPFALTRNYIKYPFSLFSLLAYLFDGEYQFVRPFIAHVGTTIETSKEMIKSNIYEYDEISLESIREIANEMHFTIYSLTDFIDSCNDKFLLADNETLISIEKTGITNSVVEEIEHLICEELQGPVIIRELRCIHNLPDINIPWTDWLLYSLLKKWSSKLEVSTTNSQFRFSLPVVARVGEMDTSAFQEIDTNISHDKEFNAFDNIDLDMLLAEEAEEELKNEFQRPEN